MQVPSVPPPIVTNAVPQDVVAKAVPNLQATAPLLKNAVAPAPKLEKSTPSRRNKDKGDHADREPKEEDGASADDARGQSVNIRV